MHSLKTTRKPSQTSNKMPISYNKIKRLYDPATFALMLLGIDSYDKCDESCRITRFGTRVMFYVTSILGLVTGVFHFGFFLDGFKMDLLSPIFFLFTGLTLRFLLYRRRDDIAQLRRALCRFEMRMEQRCDIHSTRRRFSVRCTSHFLIFLISLIVLVYYSAVTEDLVMPLSDFPVGESFLKSIYTNAAKVYWVSLLCTSYICCYLPCAMYNIIYEVLSWHLKITLKEMKDIIKTNPLDFTTNQRIYSQVRRLVELVDSNFKYTSIICALFLSSAVYFTLFNSLQKRVTFVGYQILSIIVLVSVLFSAVQVIAEAGEIPVINKEILSMVNEIPVEAALLSHKISFIHQIEQGLSLMVGGMVPINKSWSIVLIGTIMTYSLLIKSLE